MTLALLIFCQGWRKHEADPSEFKTQIKELILRHIAPQLDYSG
jgi:hypothetical protein